MYPRGLLLKTEWRRRGGNIRPRLHTKAKQ